MRQFVVWVRSTRQSVDPFAFVGLTEGRRKACRALSEVHSVSSERVHIPQTAGRVSEANLDNSSILACYPVRATHCPSFAMVIR